MAPERTRVSRFPIRQQGNAASREVVAVVLIEFVSARAFREDKERARLRIEARVVNPICKKSQLGARTARLHHEMDLVRIAEAGQDEHLWFGRMPIEKIGCATFGITTDLLSYLSRDGRHAIEHKAVGRIECIGGEERDRQEKRHEQRTSVHSGVQYGRQAQADLNGRKMLQQFNERNRDLIVNINGRLVHRDEAGISPFDSAVQGGDAVWEGLRLYHGRIFKLYEHLARLRRSATTLAFAEIPPNAKLIEEIKRTLAANDMRDGVHIRLTLTRGVKITSGMDPRLNQSGPTLIVLAEHKAPVYSKGGLTLITSKMRRPPPEVLDPQIHHANLLNSILAKIEANKAGADDALMLDLRGFVAETNATHLFLVRQGEVATSRVLACPEGDHPRDRAGDLRGGENPMSRSGPNDRRIPFRG